MKEKTKRIVVGILCLVLAVVWFVALSDWQLMLFHVIPFNNVVAGILFAVIGAINLVGAFVGKDKKETSEEK